MREVVGTMDVRVTLWVGAADDVVFGGYVDADVSGVEVLMLGWREKGVVEGVSWESVGNAAMDRGCFWREQRYILVKMNLRLTVASF